MVAEENASQCYSIRALSCFEHLKGGILTKHLSATFLMHVSINVPEQENAREGNTATLWKETVPLDE